MCVCVFTRACVCVAFKRQDDRPPPLPCVETLMHISTKLFKPRLCLRPQTVCMAARWVDHLTALIQTQLQTEVTPAHFHLSSPVDFFAQMLWFPPMWDLSYSFFSLHQAWILKIMTIFHYVDRFIFSRVSASVGFFLVPCQIHYF